MKTFVVRVSVLALAAVGFSASSIVSHSQAFALHTAKSAVVSSLPMCPWGDPRGCGLH